jgi:hypothetical protein
MRVSTADSNAIGIFVNQRERVFAVRAAPPAKPSEGWGSLVLRAARKAGPTPFSQGRLFGSMLPTFRKSGERWGTHFIVVQAKANPALIN